MPNKDVSVKCRMPKSICKERKVIKGFQNMFKWKNKRKFGEIEFEKTEKILFQ